MKTSKDKLMELYSKKSKHSNYQILSEKLSLILNQSDISTSTRSEKERLEYVLSKVDVSGKTILDIGGNTGYFCFEFIQAGAKSAHYFEGNKEHADFVRLAADTLGLNEKIKITNAYYSFDDSPSEHYNIALLFNVLHHVGDDYGGKHVSIDSAKQLIIKQLNSMSAVTDVLVFQLGFNWKGDPANGLFENGTKKEMIDFISNGIKDKWEVISIGIAEGTKEKPEYRDLADHNIGRIDKMGEFLNRPIFILKSK